MKITVTQKHIEEGQRVLCYYGPIALAIRECTGNKAQVATDEARFGDGKVVALPQKAVRFIARFDAHCKVHPFTFDLPIERKAKP